MTILDWTIVVLFLICHAVVLEEVARMAFFTVQLGNESPIKQYLLDKHFNRKHGKDAYYGQKNYF